jgi:hypothetical protein
MSHAIGGVLGPPAIWDRPTHTPRRTELVGSYYEFKRTGVREKGAAGAQIELRGDGSMHISALPTDDTTSTCNLSGDGKWGVPDGDNQLTFSIKSDGAEDSCPSGSYSFAALTGHAAPYQIYWVLGDPDSGTGVWLKKR